MQKQFMRIPYTSPFPSPLIIPSNANTLGGATAALVEFLTAPASRSLRNPYAQHDRTVLLTGAGISVASGLADYRGNAGTYTLNTTYRPIYFHEFVQNHEARKRYWARSFLGWTNLHRSRPNAAHYAVKQLAQEKRITSVITQNVDSFHPQAHPELRTLELHGYLRSLVCLTCRNEYSREQFQKQLSDLNPTWAQFLEEMLNVGALDTENPEERRKKGLKTNPDGDVHLPDAPYTTFRYPACPVCLEHPPKLADGSQAKVEIDQDGAWTKASNAGVLKPAVIMFGESIPQQVKDAAELAVDEASRILIIGSSLATYSAWRLVKRAKENGMPIGVLNLGGIRGEADFFAGLDANNHGDRGVRASQSAEAVLPAVLKQFHSPDTADAFAPTVSVSSRPGSDAPLYPGNM